MSGCGFFSSKIPPADIISTEPKWATSSAWCHLWIRHRVPCRWSNNGLAGALPREGRVKWTK